jgi:hypothetical protein
VSAGFFAGMQASNSAARAVSTIASTCEPQWNIRYVILRRSTWMQIREPFTVPLNNGWPNCHSLRTRYDSPPNVTSCPPSIGRTKHWMPLAADGDDPIVLRLAFVSRQLTADVGSAVHIASRIG